MLATLLKFFKWFIYFQCILIIGIITFNYVTYIDDLQISGSAYGFTIGSTKKETVEDIKILLTNNPNVVVRIKYGPRVMDKKLVKITKTAYSELEPHNFWWILLDDTADNIYADGIKLFFDNERLIKIYRHRKYFELP